MALGTLARNNRRYRSPITPHAIVRELPASNYHRQGEVQRTGDIFFPKNWVSALLGNYKSKEAYQELQAFFEAHPDYPSLLKNKILQAAWPLYREAANSLDM